LRGRDKVFLGMAWAALLAGLAWALSTQSRWVQEHAGKLKARQPDKAGGPAAPAKAPESEEAAAPPASATGVLGTVGEDTYRAMAKDLAARKKREAAAATAARSRPSGSDSR
jgi:uncharacterized iron-regulated membrane protein